MRVRVYQIKDTESNRKYMFASLRLLEEMGLKIEENNYSIVFNGDMDVEDPEDVYMALQDAGEWYKGRSLSISDIVVMGGKAYYCDSFGFKVVAFKENIRDITDIKVRKAYEIMGRFYNGWPLSAEEKAILAEFNIAG